MNNLLFIVAVMLVSLTGYNFVMLSSPDLLDTYVQGLVMVVMSSLAAGTLLSKMKPLKRILSTV